ncbi:hypothetical protein RDI58_021629 [Solanum bulbocastanum]|uniref:Uncharacterized protein n=1 Tax=Solanum bulbocastanum TaxID=147425 RepID=A0AAN8T2S9_SOLBU
MPLHPSDRQKIVAPQSNGIKGNSESAGKNGQNMKRKYEGDSIPSQSLAQQDEPIQQKNLNEAAEKIATTTLCKDVEEGTVSPSLDNTRSKTSDISQPPDCPSKFDNLEDFFARVSGHIKCAQSLGFSADQSSPIDGEKSATQKSTPSAEMLATAKGDIKR